MARTRPKNFVLEDAFCDELRSARRHFMDQEADILWSSLNGNLSEGVFLQMVAREGIRRMTESPAACAELWNHLPATARGYRPPAPTDTPD